MSWVAAYRIRIKFLVGSYMSSICHCPVQFRHMYGITVTYYSFPNDLLQERKRACQLQEARMRSLGILSSEIITVKVWGWAGVTAQQGGRWPCTWPTRVQSPKSNMVPKCRQEKFLSAETGISPEHCGVCP